MRKRIFASLLALVMLLSLLPTTVLAVPEDGPDDETPVVCTETADCPAEEHTEDCPLYAAPAEPETPEDGDDDSYYETDEVTDPVGPTAEATLAELIAALPDPADIDPEDEALVEAIWNQIAEIYAFADENSIDVEGNETVNAVIAAAWPAEPMVDEGQKISEDAIWDTAQTLTKNLIVNSGVTLTIGAQVTISGDVTISGGGIVKRGNDYTNALISVPETAELTLCDITIDGGATWSGNTASGVTADEAAIRIDGGKVTLDNDAVVQNNNHISTKDNSYNHTYYTVDSTKYDLPRYYNMGGGIAVYGGTLVMNDGSTVKNNAVTNTNYEKTTTGTNQTGNSDSLGGGVAVYESGTFIMNGGEISENYATVNGGSGRAFGGGVGLMTRGANAQVSSTPSDLEITFTMNGGTISENSAANGGGGIYGGVDQGDTDSAKHDHLAMTIAGKVCNNTSSGSGGGVQVGSADLKIESGAEITDNTAVSGGGIQVGSASYFAMSGGSVSNNTASGTRNAYGGGIYLNSNEYSDLTITGGTIADNSADDSGGGIQITTDRTVTISNCTLTGNSCGRSGDNAAVANGGCIQANQGVVLTLTDCTLTGNESKTGHGGGLYVSGPRNSKGGTVKLSGTMIIEENTSFLTGPNTYVNTVGSMTTLEDLNTQSKIGMTWNVSSVTEEGTTVISGVTETNCACIVYEVDGNYVLRYDNEKNTGILKAALVITLTYNNPEIAPNGDHTGERTVAFLTLANEEVNYDDLVAACGFTKEGYLISGWGYNRIGQQNYRLEFPCTFSERKSIYALWSEGSYSVDESVSFENLVYGTPPGSKEITVTAAGVEASVARVTGSASFTAAVDKSDPAKVVITPKENLSAGTYEEEIKIITGGGTIHTVKVNLTVIKAGSTVTPGDENYSNISAVYGKTITLTAKTQRAGAESGIALMSALDEVEFFCGQTSLGTAEVTYDKSGVGTATLEYDTREGGIPVNQQAWITAQYGGSLNLNGTSGNIISVILSPKPLTITGLTAENRVYDGTVNVALTGGTLTGIIGDDQVSATMPTTGTVENANAGNSKIVTIPAITLTGKDASKYTLTPPTDVTVNIMEASSTVTITPSDTNLTGGGTVTLTVSGVPEGGTVTVTQTDEQNSATKTLSLAGNGSVSVNLSNTTARYTFTVSYGGDGNHAAASDTCTVTVTRSSGGGSSSGGSSSSNSSTYTVSVDSVKHGDVATSPKNAKKGDTVTITVKPDKGYELDDLTVTDKNGDTVKLTHKSDTKYTFTMPASKVTVEASFVAIKAAPDQGLPFVDVAENAYYYDAVAWAVENGITGGTSATTFSPNAACTRAQAVTFLWRAAGSPAPKTASNTFTDVSASAYYYDAVLWAVENGITAGTSATTFSPDNTCTRGQIVTFLHRADGTAANGNNPFADVSADAYYAGPVAWAVAEGITAGTSATTFSPDASCTRAQIVTFLYRAYAD